MINFNSVRIENSILIMDGVLHGNFVEYQRKVNDTVWYQTADDYTTGIMEEMCNIESDWLEEVYQSNK
jgi:ribonucleotide reductase beta subunit family protein with ferritin-like domain